jgi:hypothetical protein
MDLGVPDVQTNPQPQFADTHNDKKNNKNEHNIVWV